MIIEKLHTPLDTMGVMPFISEAAAWLCDHDVVDVDRLELIHFDGVQADFTVAAGVLTGVDVVQVERSFSIIRTADDDFRGCWSFPVIILAAVELEAVRTAR